MAGGRVQTVAVTELHPSSMTEGTDIRRGRHFGADLAEFYGDTEPIHLLVKFLPTTAIFRLVNSLKGVSPCRLWQEFPTCAATTGRPSAVLKQQRHHLS